MFFRKNPRNRQPWPNWLKWAAIGFLALSFLGGVRNKNTPDVFHTAAQNLNPQKLLPIDSYKAALAPQEAKTLQMKDTALGTGAPAICGQQVHIGYETYEADKKTGGGQTASFTIGSGKEIPALEQGVIGMKSGGKRSVVSGKDRFEVELLDVSPEIEELSKTPYRIANVSAGGGKPVLCGEAGKFQVTIWGLDGKKLDSQTVEFTPGKSEVFLGLEQGVIGMNRGGVRTLVVPPTFQNSMNGNTPTAQFPLPKEQTVLVDVEAVQ